MPWTVTDLKEVVALAVVGGSFLAWVSALRASRGVSLREAEAADRTVAARWEAPAGVLTSSPTGVLACGAAIER